MQRAGDFLQVIGLLAVLGSAALVFVNLVRWIAGKRGNQVRLGAEMLVFFSLAYGFHDEVLRFISFTAYARDVGDAMATMWWLSLAFIVNESLKRFVWLGVLSERGQRKVPRLLTDFVAVGVYLIAIMAVMHFVYEKPITAIAATSGAAAFIIGYSAQSTLGELFAGVSLNASGKLRKGDYVRIDDIYGTVHDVDWRSVTVHHYLTDSLVVFPQQRAGDQAFPELHAPDRRHARHHQRHRRVHRAAEPRATGLGGSAARQPLRAARPAAFRIPARPQRIGDRVHGRLQFSQLHELVRNPGRGAQRHLDRVPPP